MNQLEVQAFIHALQLFLASIQGLHHVIEGISKLLQFVASAQLAATGKITSADSVGDLAQAPNGGRARYVFFANEGAKDILAKHRGGHAAPWEIPDDVGADFTVQINAEIKKDTIQKVTKAVCRRWVRVGNRPNHLWDCCVMQIVAALIKGVIPDYTAKENASNPVSETVVSEA